MELLNSPSLVSVTPNFLTTGIFAHIQNVEFVDTTTAPQLNALYYGNRSGNKAISSLVNMLLSTDGTLSSASLDSLAGMITASFSAKWAQLWRHYSNLATNFSLIDDTDYT